MQRALFLTGAGAALFATPAPALARPVRRPSVSVSIFADDANGRWGADINIHELDGIQSALSPSELAGTIFEPANAAPAGAHAVTLSNLPAVMAQGGPGHAGSPGSCEADSFGYCLGAYTAARNPNGSIKWSAADPRNAPSAAWLYQWEHVVAESGNRVCPQGSGATPYANHLVRFGAPSVADYPYNPHDATAVRAMCAYIKSLPVQSAPAGQSRLIVGSYKGLNNVTNGKSKYLSQFKEFIRAGHAIAFTGSVAKGYGVPTLTRGAFTAPAGFIPKSGHGQVIVGYADDVGPNGAFLVQNSFGPSWNPGTGVGHNGRMYWDYDAFFASQAYAIVMFPNTSLPVTGTMLKASLAGAPKFAVKSAKLSRNASGKSQILLVAHASDGLMMKHLSVTPPSGTSVQQNLNAMMRLGYQYVEDTSGANWSPGSYKVAYTAQDRHNQTIVYRGTVHVT